MDYEPPSSCLKIHTTEDILHDKLQVLWVLEKTPEAPKLDPADETAVHHFEDTHIIAEDTALQEYLDLGHAEKVPSSELSLNHYYLPVHGVFKSTSLLPKFVQYSKHPLNLALGSH